MIHQPAQPTHLDVFRSCITHAIVDAASGLCPSDAQVEPNSSDRRNEACNGEGEEGFVDTANHDAVACAPIGGVADVAKRAGHVPGE